MTYIIMGLAIALGFLVAIAADLTEDKKRSID